MSRGFKSEYEGYLKEQTPDLWSRIEANLPEKQVSAPQMAVQTREAASNTTRRNRREKGQKRSRARIWRYSLPAAAAALFCVVAMPLFVGRSKTTDSAENASQYIMLADGAVSEREEAEVADQEEIAGVGQTTGSSHTDGGVQESDGQATSGSQRADAVHTAEDGSEAGEMQQDKLATEELKGSAIAEVEELMSELVVSDAKIELLEELEQQEGILRYLAVYDGREVILACTQELASEHSLEAGKSCTADLGSAREQENSQNGVLSGSQSQAEYDYLILTVK